jgi:UDP-N-acetylglucosamine transferase subunit ALG13
MIYVTVGKMPLPFDRLVKAADELAEKLGVEVFIQRGSSTYKPLHAAYKDFLTFPESVEMFEKASVVVSHAGIGTIIGALRAGTPIAIVLRRRTLGEHFSDHQAEIAQAVQGRPGVEVVEDLSRLADTVQRLRGMKGKLAPTRAGSGIIEAIDSFLSSACKE